jgi:hypothetical protein
VIRDSGENRRPAPAAGAPSNERAQHARNICPYGFKDGDARGHAGFKANALSGALALIAIPAEVIRCTLAGLPLIGHVQDRHVVHGAISRIAA